MQKDANVLLNVSEFEGIDEATESLVSMSQAYKDLDKMDIIDVLNNIGNNYSISTDGLATALKDSASALVTANNDLNEAVSLTTAGNAITQDPSKVGAGLRTISLRLVGTEEAKQELSDLGEETDGMITTVSKLRIQLWMQPKLHRQMEKVLIFLILMEIIKVHMKLCKDSQICMTIL